MEYGVRRTRRWREKEEEGQGKKARANGEERADGEEERGGCG